MSKYTPYSPTSYTPNVSKNYTPVSGTNYTPTNGTINSSKTDGIPTTTINATVSTPKTTTNYSPLAYKSPTNTGGESPNYKYQPSSQTQDRSSYVTNDTANLNPGPESILMKPQISNSNSGTRQPYISTGVSYTPTKNGSYGKPLAQTDGIPQLSSTSQVKPTQLGVMQPQIKPTTEIKTEIKVEVNQKPDLNDFQSKAKFGKNVLKSTINKTSSTSVYDTLMAQLKATGETFRDLEFSANLQSIAGGDPKLAAKWSAVVWRTPEDFFGKDYAIFKGGIEPDDIKQGALGDCYFLSSLSALAEFPARIEKLFRNTQVNPQKCYVVRICDMGEWKEIILDDLFPCKDKTSGPIFTKGNDHELWVLLLEKAWAKIYGSYAKIEAGLPREVLHDLTGAPTEYFLTQGEDEDVQKVWRALESGDQKNYVMCCGSGDLANGEDVLTSSGLVGSHAYSLISALTVKTQNGPVRLVKLRNPWGESEWKGAWSDYSNLWTPDLKKQVGLEERDDGCFFMSFEDFCQYFTDVQICRVHDDYEYSSLRFPVDPKHAVYLRFTINKEGHYYITINQRARRHFKNSDAHQYSGVSLVVGRELPDGEFEYVEGIQNADREVWTDGFLKPGNYIAYVKVSWRDGKTQDVTISTYGIGNTSFELVHKSLAKQFLEKVYSSKAMTSPQLKSYAEDGEPNVFKCFENTDDGFGYFFFWNKGESTLQAEIFFKTMSGVRLRKPMSGKSFKIAVPPQQKAIVLTKINPDVAVRQAYSEIPTFQRSQGQLRTLAKEKGQKKQKKNQKTGEMVEVWCYVYQHSDGVFFLYENNTKDLTLEEEVKFNLQGLQIEEDACGSSIKFVLPPGEVKEIKLKKTQNAFSIGFSSGYLLKSS